MNLKEIRQKYPEYKDIPDEQLAIKLHKKYYSDIPLGEFAVKIGVGKTDPTEGMSGLDKFLAGTGKAFTDIVRGTGQLVGLTNQANIQESQRLDAPLMNTGAGMAGNVAGNIAAFGPTAFIPGVNTVTGAGLLGAGIGLTQPVAEGDVITGKAKNAALGATLSAGTQLGLNKVTQSFANKADELAKAKLANASKDAAAKAAREAGYVLPPSQANPTAVNNVLESASGQVQTAKHAASRNQDLTNTLIKRSLGASDDVPAAEAISAAQQKAGAAYEAVRALGTINADDKFMDAVSEATKAYEKTSKAFKSSKNPSIEALMDDMLKDSFDADTVVDMVRQLRRESGANFRASDGKMVDLARVQKKLATALEDLIERNIDDPSIMQAFREGRTLYAQTIAADKALNHATGDFAASKFGDAVKKGKPLTGDMAVVGETAAAFPDAMKTVRTSVLPSSPLDTAVAVGGSLASGNYGPLSYMLGRPAIRNAILSGPYQNIMLTPNYEAGKMIPGLLSDPITQHLLRTLGPSVMEGN